MPATRRERLSLRPMNEADAIAIETWFTDAETSRWLGDTSWPHLLLRLVSPPNRLAFVAVQDERAVGLVDVEVGNDGRAAMASVVAPEMRRSGVATAMIAALLQRPELRRATALGGGVETGNVAGEMFVRSAGFEQLSEPDEQGFAYFERPLRTAGVAPAV